MTNNDPYLPSTSRPELAPSEVRTDEPTLARLLGAAGLAAALLGSIAIIANEFGPRFVGKGGGYCFAILGFAAMLYHAMRDSDIEFRRAYTWMAYVLLALFAVIGLLILTGNEATAAIQGKSMLTGAGAIFPVLLGFLGLAFLLAPLRNETSSQQRAISQLVLLVFGGVLTLGAVVIGLASKDLLVGPGFVMALLGIGFICAFLSQAGSSEGIGHFIATMLGVLGALALAYALGNAIWPTVLYEGPSAIKNAFQTRDTWKLAARVAVVLLFASLAFWGIRTKSFSIIARGLMVMIGLSFAGVLVLGLVSQQVTTAPKQYLVPFGLILGLIGIIYLVVSLAYVSDSAFITLCRRELAAYFVSPIAYFALIGMTLIGTLGYANFLSDLEEGAGQIREPILQYFGPYDIIGAIATLFIIPAITMRSFSEEKRSGTLEVLLTAPVSEVSIVLSKFLAAWLLYILMFLPAGLFLVALRVEGGVPFDYRPLLSFYVAAGLNGIAFVAIGLVFSSLTHNQIVAAMLTFAGMLFLMLTFILQQFVTLEPFHTLFTKLDYITFWRKALSGQMLISQGLISASLGVFALFLTVKVLEFRKWG
ncbi:hypothetical protein BH11PLA2_BH11PLA2_04430 [soil metagenome]